MKKLLILLSMELLASCFYFIPSTFAEESTEGNNPTDYEKALQLVQDTDIELTEDLFISEFDESLDYLNDFIIFYKSMNSHQALVLPNPNSRAILESGERIAQWTIPPYHYINKMTIEGDIVFCLDAGILAGTGSEYNPSYDWSMLTFQTQLRIWEVIRFGYQLYGTDEYYIASQMLVWDALGYNVSIDKDYSAAAAQIEWNIHNYYKTPNFDNVPQDMSLHVPVTITDNNDVLNTFDINCKSGVSCDVSGNDLTITINSIHYDKDDTITFSKGNAAAENVAVVWTLPDSQRVAKVGYNDPFASFAINPRLATGDLKINKLDEFLNDAEPGQAFSIWFSENTTDEATGGIIPTWYKGEPIPNADGGHWYTGANGDLDIIELLPVGFYIIEEVETTNPYEINHTPILIEIKLNELIVHDYYNSLRNVAIQVNKVDAEETWRKLNGAEFTVYDITDSLNDPIPLVQYHLKNKLTYSLKQYLNPTKENYRYSSINEVVATIDTEGAVTTLTEGYTAIQIFDAEDNFVKQVDLIVTDQTEDFKEVELDATGTMPLLNAPIPIFRGVTGDNFIHVVDIEHHNFPVANTVVGVYSDPGGLYLVAEKTTDEFGYINTDDLEVGQYYYSNPTSSYSQLTPFEVLPSEELQGFLNIQNLKWGRTYEVCETKLPEGYDFLTTEEKAAGASCEVITMDLAINVEHESRNYANQLRRLDVTLYKQNESRSILLNGATFEVWDIYEEGLDLGSLIDPEFPTPMIKTSEYLGEYITGALLIKETKLEMIDPAGEDIVTNWHEVPHEGIKYNVSTLEDMSIIHYSFTTNADGEILEYLPDGKYYVQKVSEEPNNPITVYYISKGTIFMSELKYGHSYLICETKAPSGYYINDDGCEVLTPTAPYGVNQIENYRINLMRKIPIMSDN